MGDHQMQLMVVTVDIWNLSVQFLLQQLLYPSIFTRHKRGTIIHLTDDFLISQVTDSIIGELTTASPQFSYDGVSQCSCISLVSYPC